MPSRQITWYFSLCALLLVSLIACGVDETDALVISDLRVRAPIPGSTTSVAYFTITNHSHQDIVISEITSPQFTGAEIHRTELINGVSSMRRVENLVIPANDAVELVPGSYHLMLFTPQSPLAPGQSVSLLIHYSDNRVLNVAAPLGKGFD